MDIDIAIRDAVVEDAEQIVALVESAYRGDSSRAGWTTEADLLEGNRTDIDEVSKQIVGDETVMLLAEDETEGIVGCCHLKLRADGAAYFGMFAIRPTMQAGGVGGRLLAAAEQRAIELFAAPVMAMWVLNLREELIAWYLRKGYAHDGKVFADPWLEGAARVPGLAFIELTKPLAIA